MTNPVTRNELGAFFTYVVDVLESLDIPYMVVGGFAAIFYGEPRMTIDVDIVVDMKPTHVRLFVAAFPIPDFYVSEEGIRDSLQRRYPFNVIEPSTGAKIDLVPLSRDPFSRAIFERRQRIVHDVQGHSATFITAEDIVVAKLRAFQETGSDKHLRDARGVIAMQEEKLNINILKRRARVAQVGELLEQALALVAPPSQDEQQTPE